MRRRPIPPSTKPRDTVIVFAVGLLIVLAVLVLILGGAIWVSVQ